MVSETAQRITRIAVCATFAAALALLILVLWSWLAKALSDPTVPIVLVGRSAGHSRLLHQAGETLIGAFERPLPIDIKPLLTASSKAAVITRAVPATRIVRRISLETRNHRTTLL
jgi:hypothetical protein